MSDPALPPSASTTLVIELGASAWPNSPGFQTSEAFGHAAQGFRDYLLDPHGFDLPPANFLDLFDATVGVSDQLEKLASFLEQRTQALKAAKQDVRDVLVYFVGHGGFSGPSADFYLLLHRTHSNSLRSSGMSIDALAEVLREKARQTRRYLFLDCCFAAAAFRSFQGGPDQTAIARTLDAFHVQARSSGFPRKGTVLLCSSDQKSPSLLLPDESCTMFSYALLDVLRNGDLHRPLQLSLRDIKELAQDRLAALPERNAPRPGLYSPDQSEGDVADVPFFRNISVEREMIRQAEEEKRRLAEEAERAYRAEEERLRQAEEARRREIEEERARKEREEEQASLPMELVAPTSQAQPQRLEVNPTDSALHLGMRDNLSEGHSIGVREIPQLKKGVNVRLMTGIISLLVVLIGGSISFAIFRAGTTNKPSGSSDTTPITHPSTVKAALVTDIGGLNDSGYNQFSHAGYEKARAQYGFPDVVIQSTVISDDEYTKNITAAAQQADMVIGVGFLMQNAIYTVAKQYPNKEFALIDGCATNPTDKTGACQSLPNVAPLFFKEQEAGCLVGAIAGQMEVDGKSKVPKLLGHNTISAVGGLPIPPVVRYIAGYKYCARKVDPSVNVVVGYSNNFADPTMCSAIADKQISDNQADILFQVAGGCGLGVLDSATKNSVYSIGLDVDQSHDSTGAVRPSVISSAIKRVDTAVYDIIQLAETGGYAGFAANPFLFDLAHDGVGYATPSSDVPQDAVAKAMAFADMIKSGALVPPEMIVA